MNAELIIACGSHKGEVIKVDIEVFLIGRSSKADLRVKSDSVSRKHCAIISRNGKLYAADMESRNGTIINGEKIPPGKKVRLHDGDILQLGKMKLIVQVVESKVVEDGLSVVLKSQMPPDEAELLDALPEGGKQTLDQHTLTIDGIDFSGWNVESKEMDSEELEAIRELGTKRSPQKDHPKTKDGPAVGSGSTNFDTEEIKNSLALTEAEERRKTLDALSNRKSNTSQEAATDAIRRMLGGGR